MASKIIAYGIKVDGLDKTVGTYGELLELIKNSREELKKVDPSRDGPAARQALERYALAKEAQKQFNATVKETQMQLAAAAEAGTGSYRELQNTMSILKRQFKELSKDERNSQLGEGLKNRIKEISSELKEIDSSIGDNFRNVGNYAESIQSAFSGLNLGGVIRGDLSSLGSIIERGKDGSLGLASGLTDAISGAGGLAGAAKLIGPAFAFQAILSGLTSVISTINEAIEVARQADDLITNIGGLSQDESTGATSRLIALSKSTGLGTEQLFVAANAQAKQFNISLEESLDLLSKSSIVAGTFTDEIVDQTREYSVFFSELGIEASRFQSIITKSIQDGIFSDKGVDSLKEAAIQLRELPKPAREAVNALGIDDATISQVKSESGVLGLLELVLEQFRKVPEGSELAGQALADIFKGAGEDAGADFLRNVNLVNEGIDSLIDSSNSYQAQRQKELDINRQIAEQQKEISDNFGKTRDEYVANYRIIYLDLLKTLNFITSIDSEIEKLDEKFNAFLLDNLSPVLDRLGTFGQALRDALAPDEIARSAEEVNEALGNIALGVNLIEGLKKQQDENQQSRFRNSLASSEATSLPIGVFAIPAAKPTDDELEKQKKAREAEQAKEKAKRDALTGLQEVRADLEDVRAEILSNVGDAAKIALLEAEKASLEQLEKLLESKGKELVEKAIQAIPDLNTEIDEVLAQLADPSVDQAIVFERFNELARDRLQLLKNLEKAQNDLASSEELQSIAETLERFASRPEQTFTTLETRTLQSVTSQAEGQSDQADIQDFVKQKSDESTSSQLENIDELTIAYRGLGGEIQNVFAEAFESGEFSAEKFSKAVLKSVINTFDKEVQAIAFKAFANIVATLPPPAGIIAGTAASALILGGWEAAKSQIGTFALGGVLEGPSHERRGIVATIGGRPVAEMEGEEGIMRKTAMRSNRRFEFQGRMLTPRQIGGALNETFGGRPWTTSRIGNVYELGGVLSPVAIRSNAPIASQGFSDEQIRMLSSMIESAVERGAENGANRGTQQGITRAEAEKRFSTPVGI